MEFYFINEDNTFIHLKGNLNQMVKQAKDRTKVQKHWTGVIGVIDDKYRVRSSVIFRYSDKTVHTKIIMFIRKYSAMGVLQELASMLKEK